VKKTNLILLVLALLGAIDAIYLSWLQLTSPATCIGGGHCLEVILSESAKVAGIHFSTIGVGYYLVLTVIALVSITNRQVENNIKLMSLVSVFALITSVYLVYTQAVVLDAWCKFCLISAAINVVIFATLLIHHMKEGSSMITIPKIKISHLGLLLILVTPSISFSALEAKIGHKGHTNPLVAEFGGERLKLSDIDKQLKLDIYKLEKEQYELRKQVIDNKLLGLVANQKNLDVRRYLERYVWKKIKVSEAAVEDYIKQNKSRIPPTMSDSKVRYEVRKQLVSHERQHATQTHLKSLYLRPEYKINIPKPTPINIKNNPRGGPQKGAKNAKVKIIEFSDFQCPFCQRAHRYLNEMVKKYPDDISVVFRNFPLNMHSNARTAAQAGFCAQKQNKFWQLADQMFSNQKLLAPVNVETYALSVGINMSKFKKCVSSSAAKKAVQKDVDEGDNIGINSTPTIFVNGELFQGLPSEEELIDLIQSN
jgi:protein-disulfide isomerase/uncharacterized membrane protein